MPFAIPPSPQIEIPEMRDVQAREEEGRISVRNSKRAKKINQMLEMDMKAAETQQQEKSQKGFWSKLKKGLF